MARCARDGTRSLRGRTATRATRAWFVDRLLLEEDPHAVLAGMAACARVIGATQGIVYIRAESLLAQERTCAA
ncbi:MAG: hypothetical protein U1E76_00135 [Planctomycetota bacterium]